jgi:hypothetical protein
MSSVLIGAIVGIVATTWMQLAGATVVVMAVLKLVINLRTTCGCSARQA